MFPAAVIIYNIFLLLSIIDNTSISASGLFIQSSIGPAIVCFFAFFNNKISAKRDVFFLVKLSTKMVCHELLLGECSMKILQGITYSIRWRIWKILYKHLSVLIVLFSQAKTIEMLSTLHLTYLLTKLFGCDRNGKMIPISSKSALL